MKAILQNIKTGLISVEDIPQPILKSGNVLVRNICSLVSAGTEKSVLEFSKANYMQKALKRPDLLRKVLNRAKNEGIWQTYKIVSNLIDQPIQLGYSSAGIVMEVGKEITDIQIGQKVACAGLFVATHSEVISVPRNLLTPIPEGVPFDEACFVTLGAIAMQGVRLADLSLGENVVVYGVGLVGMVAAQLAVAAGCRVIGVDVDMKKVEMVKKFGCHGVFIANDLDKTILNLTDGYGADKVILCAATKSNEPIEKIPTFTRQKGVLVVVGDVPINIPRRDYYNKEIDIRISRSYGPGRYDLSYEEGGIDYPYAYVRWTENRNMQAVLDLLARRRLDFESLITHRFGIAEAKKAYELIEGKIQEPYLGVVIRYCEDIPQDKVSSSVTYHEGQKVSGELNLGIIGAGNFAKAFLLPAFSGRQGVRLRSICTASGVSASSVAKKYHANLATSNPDDIFNDPEIGAILIATRHDSHAKYVMRGLNSGKAVYVEKPLAITLDDLEKIKELYEQLISEKEHPFLMVGYNRRFSPLSVLLKKTFLKTTSPISMIYRVNAGFIPLTEWVHNPAVGGGRIIGECCHFIDFMSYLTGTLPINISANALQHVNSPVRDIVTLTIQFADGSLGTVHYFANGNSSMPKEYIEVFGDGISAQLINYKHLAIYGAQLRGKKRYINQAKGFQEEAEAFVNALKNGSVAPIPFDQLYMTSKATILAEQALNSGKSIEL
jgi:predicted dehydrogenase/threonine dehydrogenase-like Zn-dependent dehydrogenase